MAWERQRLTRPGDRVSKPVKRDAERSLSSSGIPAKILGMQQTLGNQAVQRLFKSGVLQAKLRIGQPGDIYEQEADRMAEQVVRMPEPQTKAGETDHGYIQPSIVPPIVHDVLRSHGQALDPTTRAFMESRFGHDFSKVRVHTDANAAESARAVNALAYTVGQDIVFGTDQYMPETFEGKSLLTHELVHVIQQRLARIPSELQLNLKMGKAETGTKGEAKRIADEMVTVSLMATRTEMPCMNSIGSLSITSPVLQRRISPDMPKIRENLTYRFLLDWVITEAEAHEVLMILKNLSDDDLRDTVAAMEQDGLVDRFYENLSEADIKAEQDILRRIKNFRVYTKVTKEGETTVATTLTGSCNFQQAHEISMAVREALAWLDKTIKQLDAYIAYPEAAASKPVQDALQLHFKSTTSNIAVHVRDRLNSIQSDIRHLNPFTVECHGTWDLECKDNVVAYVPGKNREMIVFCNRFFKGAKTAQKPQIETIVHEMAHTQVGGTHITDRGYAHERILRHLTTTEALTNAESYGLLVEQLATGKVPSMPAPSDTFEDCSQEWKDAIEIAIAKAQYWNYKARSITKGLTPAGAQKLLPLEIQYLGGITQTEIETAHGAYKLLDEELGSPIDFECEPEGGGRCDSGFRTYWYAIGDLHVCPLWMKDSPEDRVVALLAGLYGYKAGVDNKTHRWNYARLAQSLVARYYAVPTLPRVLGGPAWSADSIRIQVEPVEPRTPSQAYYTESGSLHERLSDQLPVYEAPPCQAVTLPFRLKTYFAVDYSNIVRPAPFTPPRITVKFRFVTPGGPTSQSESDPRADYAGPGVALQTKFPYEFGFSLSKNGPLNMEFTLQDPDTGITRVFKDTIEILAVRPCDLPKHLPEERYA
jgi:hypothetical protein